MVVLCYDILKTLIIWNSNTIVLRLLRVMKGGDRNVFHNINSYFAVSISEIIIVYVICVCYIRCLNIFLNNIKL